MPLRLLYDNPYRRFQDYRGSLLTLWRAVSARPNLALVAGGIGVGGLLLRGPFASIAVSVVISVGVAVAVYLHQIDRLSVSWLPWRRWWRPANRPLTLSLLALASVLGVGVGLQHLWQRSPWPGLTTLVLVQTAMMAIALLSRLGYGRLAHSPRAVSKSGEAISDVEPILTALASEHPVHQLVAIRRALAWASTAQDPAAVDDIADCFTVLLRRHPDPTVRQSLQRGLVQLRPRSPMAPLHVTAACEPALESAPLTQPVPISAES